MIYLSCMRLNSLSLSKRSSVSEPFDMEIRSGIQPVKACRSMFYNINAGSDLLTTRLAFVSINGEKLLNVIMYNVIWTNQKTESSEYCWQRAHASFDITCICFSIGRLFKRSVSTLSKTNRKYIEGLVQTFCNIINYI